MGKGCEKYKILNIGNPHIEGSGYPMGEEGLSTLFFLRGWLCDFP
jgi:hypothetical protein